MSGLKKITIPFFISHQGCPNTCVFCDQRTISGSQGNLPTNEEIVAKVLDWQRFAGSRPLEAAFFGGTFTALSIDTQKRLLAPLQPFRTSGELTSIRISTRPDNIDLDTVHRLAEWGVGIIELGVQSMDDTVLAASGRGHDAASSFAAINCISSCGLSVGAQLMPGLPKDTPATSLRSLQKVISAGVDFIRLYPAVVFRGTELATMYENGDYCPLSIDDGVAVCKVLLQTALKAGVDVIRIGLQADEGINIKSVLAGCWHPALGQLVRSELYFDALLECTSGLPDNETLTARCHPTRLSDVTGHGGKNLSRLLDRGVRLERIRPDNSLSVNDVAIDTLKQTIKNNIMRTKLY